MKYLLQTLIILGFVITTWADNPVGFKFESWKIDRDFILFYELPQRGISIQKGCEKESSGCALWTLKKKLSLKIIDKDDLLGGKNPGAVLCHKLKLPVLIGVSPNGNRQSFCMASDGTLFSSATAYRWAMENGP